jgi:hypothetical protein
MTTAFFGASFPVISVDLISVGNIGTDYAGKKISNVIELIVDVDKMEAHSCVSCPPAQNAAVPGAAV